MEIYKKILRFVRPFLKHVALSLLLTFVYVLLNNVSLWVSVDFVGELFLNAPADTAVVESPSPEGIPPSSDALLLADTDSSAVVSPVKEESGNWLEFLDYKRFKATMQGLLRQESKSDTLRVICLVIFITFVLKNIFDYLRRVINRYIQLKVVVDLRNRLQETAVRLPLGYFTSSHTGKLTSIIFNDVKALRQVLNNSLGKMILTPIQLLTNIAILFWISWKLSLITLIIIPVSSVIIYKIGQSMRRKSRRVFKQISEVMALFQEAVSSIQVVKAYTSEQAETEKFQAANRRFFKIQMRANRLSQATSPLNEIVAVSVLVVLLWYGGNMVHAGEFDADDFVKFLLFLFTCLQPLREFSRLNNILQRGVAAAERIFDVMDTEREAYAKTGDHVLSQFAHGIELEQVVFQYSNDGPAVLKGIDLEIKKGETVAFVGHSGSGKTTLVNLIPRFYNVNAGQIRVDGHDIQDVTLTSLRDQIGIVTQETFLFNDTIRYNIAYGLTDVADEAITAAAKAANAWEFIQDMDDGMDAMVGERGLNLSGGQKQRLSIARAILKNPPILILDEATSALDTESEKLVQDAIENIMENRTVLVIAHRLSTVIHADKIVVLNHGEIAGMGTHHELLKGCPIYKNLYDIQFRSEPDEPENNDSSQKSTD